MLAPPQKRPAVREDSHDAGRGARATHPVASTLNASPRVRQLQAQAAGLNAREPNRTGLPDRLKSGIEQLSGVAMDDVRVHYGSSRPARLQAHAFAHGTDIHVAPGQERHVPHEAWHVVQQKQGRVPATTSLAGTPVNDDSALEAEADRLGSMAGRHAGSGFEPAVAPSSVTAPVVQGFWHILAGAAAAAGALGLAYLGWRNYQHARAEPDRRGMVRDVLAESQETERRRNIEFTGNVGRSETGRAPIRGMPGYRINIDPNNPISAEATGQLGQDRRLRQTARVHELTHVAVFEGYGGRNRNIEIGENMRTPRGPDRPTRQEIAERASIIGEIDALDRIRLADPVVSQLPQGQQDYIRDRIEYMQATPTAEFDTVLNELVLHFHMWGISPHSPLSIALVQAARERMTLRNAP